MADVSIFFGSQSGTAECFSEEIKEEAEQHGITAEVIDLQRFTVEDYTACRIAVLVVSTYGDGEPSDNAAAFHRWAMDPRHDGAAKGQRFTVMGLGDMNYSKFNNMGMMTDLNLERLGATRIYRRGIGDDSQDIAADFANWKAGGLWAALEKAVAEVRQEGPRNGAAATCNGQVQASAPVVVKPELHVFFAHEEADGAASDCCSVFQDCCKSSGLEVSIVQSLKDRKAIEAIKKLPKNALAVVIADVGPDGICAAARKLVRNMSLELDSASLKEKQLRLCQLTVATSKCNNSAASLKSSIEQHGLAVYNAFERAGVDRMETPAPSYVDAGVEDVQNAVRQVCDAVAKHIQSNTKTIGGQAAPAQASAQAAADAKPQNVSIFCAGGEAKEAGEALSSLWSSGSVTVEDASLAALASAAQRRVQAIVAVECAADGSLSDAARGLATQLGAAPMAIRAQLKQLRFALLAVAATDYGNAGERASASAALEDLTRAATPVSQALSKAGAGCVATCSVDLQDSNEDKLKELCSKLTKGFAAGSGVPTPLRTDAAAGYAPASKPTFGTPKFSIAARGATLPEAKGEPSDVLARFYFDAQKAKVLKVRELRQKPDVEQGLSTVEVEIEAAGDLKGYTLGGTLSLMPQNDPADVKAVLPLIGFTEADLDRPISFVALEGAAMSVKLPFPAPCKLGDALACYCDLTRVPSKKMLQAMQAGLSGEARACVEKLIADAEALKLLSASPLCCSMREFWELLGVTTGLDPCAFLLNCPRQKAREFTIASSPKVSPNNITICVSLTSHESESLAAVVDKLNQAGCLPASAVAKAGTRAPRFFGLCSKWLSTRLKVGDVVAAKQRSSPLQLPGKDVPIVMVGAGAGVAPFRGFWEDLKRGSQTAPAALFFGCRNSGEDWLYKDEMNAAVKLGAGCGALARMQVGPKRPITCLFPAFSRPGEGKEKQYVQDLIRAQSASLKAWIDNMGGSVFICGSSAMGTGVLDALGETLSGGREAVEALRKEGRIVAEMWG